MEHVQLGTLAATDKGAPVVASNSSGSFHTTFNYIKINYLQMFTVANRTFLQCKTC